MTYIPCVQGSAEWLQERCGRITASRVADVMAVLKRDGESAARESYRMELLAERLTGRSSEHFVTHEMKWGTENESLARAAYEVETGNSVDVVGFYVHPEMDFAGASPDGAVGPDGAIEIKCPKTTTHLRWTMAGVVPPEHLPQMTFVLACTGRKWCDFVSFDPRLPMHLQLYVRRLERNEDSIAEIEFQVAQMNAEVDVVLGRFFPAAPACLAAPEKTPSRDPVLDSAFLSDEDFRGLINA